MADDINNMEHLNDPEGLRSRRTVLRMMAAAPLMVTYGMLASPLMRFLKPTMQPGNFFPTADLPTGEQLPVFIESDLPEIGTCLPFMFPMKYLVFNPEQYEIRKIPSLIIRLGKNQIVAFSRICPKQHDHILNYVRPAKNGSCGCADGRCKGACIGYAKNPVLICPCDKSIFDVSDNGRVLSGPAPYGARQFAVERNGDRISILHLEAAGIA
jgi:Rieske Fe-S protein